MKSLKFVLFAGDSRCIAVPAARAIHGPDSLQFIEAVQDATATRQRSCCPTIRPIIEREGWQGRHGAHRRALATATATGRVPARARAPTPTTRRGRRHAPDRRRQGRPLRRRANGCLGSAPRSTRRTRSGETPLIIAVQQRRPRLVRVFLEHGADPDQHDAAAGYSARDYATRDARARGDPAADRRRRSRRRPPTLVRIRQATGRSAPPAGGRRAGRNGAARPCAAPARAVGSPPRERPPRRSGRRRSAPRRPEGSAPPREYAARCGGTAQKKRSQ